MSHPRMPSNGAACDSARANLDGYLSGELPAETRREVARHLAACPSCAAEFEAQSRLRAHLQTAVRATVPPPALEAKVRRAVRASSAPLPRVGFWAIAAAAAVLLSIALVNYLRQRANPEQAILSKATGRLAAILNIGLRDHLQCAVFRKYPKQPLPESQMAADLGPGFTDLLPSLAWKLPGDLHVIQAHHCEANGRRYTHFIIAGTGDRDGKIVSLIITRRQPGESLSSGIQQIGVDRFQVVGFESHDYLAFVISDLDAQQDLQLAASLAPTVREFLAAHPG